MLLFSTKNAKGCSHFNKWNILTHFSHPSSYIHTHTQHQALMSALSCSPSIKWTAEEHRMIQFSFLARFVFAVPSFNPSIYHIPVVLSSLYFSHGMCLRLRETPNFWHQHRSKADGSDTRQLIWACHGRCSSSWHHYKAPMCGHIPWHTEPEHICTGGQHPTWHGNIKNEDNKTTHAISK